MALSSRVTSGKLTPREHQKLLENIKVTELDLNSGLSALAIRLSPTSLTTLPAVPFYPILGKWKRSGSPPANRRPLGLPHSSRALAACRPTGQTLGSPGAGSGAHLR